MYTFYHFFTQGYFGQKGTLRDSQLLCFIYFLPANQMDFSVQQRHRKQTNWHSLCLNQINKWEIEKNYNIYSIFIVVGHLKVALGTDSPHGALYHTSIISLLTWYNQAVIHKLKFTGRQHHLSVHSIFLEETTPTGMKWSLWVYKQTDESTE